jgi:hypothetical protein
MKDICSVLEIFGFILQILNEVEPNNNILFCYTPSVKKGIKISKTIQIMIVTKIFDPIQLNEI